MEFTRHRIFVKFFTDELVYIHPGKHPRVIKGKEQFKKYLEVF
jgi:hypothetical protein